MCHHTEVNCVFMCWTVSREPRHLHHHVGLQVTAGIDYCKVWNRGREKFLTTPDWLWFLGFILVFLSLCSLSGASCFILLLLRAFVPTCYTCVQSVDYSPVSPLFSCQSIASGSSCDCLVFFSYWTLWIFVGLFGLCRVPVLPAAACFWFIWNHRNLRLVCTE